ncbi:unnamed protein product [Alternaria alternata]
MGDSYGYLRNVSGSPFQFAVIEACQAEKVNLTQACNLTFSANHRLILIGDVGRGAMVPQPGIAGIGIWYATVPFFVVVLMAVAFIPVDVYRGRDKPDEDTTSPKAGHRRSKLRAAGRTFVLGVADTQTVFVGGFLLSFAGRNKCTLSSYHFTAAVSQMMIALSVITMSVAVVRTYWRNPLAAALRLVLSLGAFIGVGITIYREANYAPFNWMKPPDKDSAILLPAACLLEGTLRPVAETQARDNLADLGFGDSKAWPFERYFFIVIAGAFLVAHILVPFRYYRSRRNRAPKSCSPIWGLLEFVYWVVVLIAPTLTAVLCWVRVYIMRKWVDESGWLESPNTEMDIWDSGGLIAMGILITVLMNVLTEAFERKKKDANKGIEDGAAYKLLGSRDRSLMHMNDRGYNRGPNRPFNTSRPTSTNLGYNESTPSPGPHLFTSRFVVSESPHSTGPATMFTSFTGNTRKARQVNLGGKKTNPFGPPGSGAGSQAALDRAQQDRVQRQRERDTLNAAKRIQKVWRGHSARRDVADELRGAWDRTEESGGSSHTVAYSSEDEALAQLQRLLRFASSRSDDDLRRIQHYASRQMEAVKKLGIASSGPWPWAYLRLQRILLVAIERQLQKTSTVQWQQIKPSVVVLHFLADQIPAETSQNAQNYYRALAHVVSTFTSILEAQSDGSDVSEIIARAAISPMKRVTGYTLDAYEAFGIRFLTLPLLASDSTSPCLHKFRDSLADSINYKLLANALATLSKRAGLQSKAELKSTSSRLRLLGNFIYFHRYAHNFDTPEAYAIHKNFVAVVSVLLNSLPVNIVDDGHPIAELSEDGIEQDSEIVSGFLKEQVGSLVHQEGIGSLLAGSSQSAEASDDEKVDEARQLANYALALLRFFPRRGDEIRMWLYIGPSEASEKSTKKLPAIRYFWEASKRSSVFSTIFKDSRAAIGLLKPKSSNMNGSDRPGTSGLTHHGFWQPAQQQVDRDATTTDEWRVIFVFLELYTFVLKVTDDEEFFTSGQKDVYSGQIRDSGLPLTEVKDLTTFLKNLGFTLYFNAVDITNSDEDTRSNGTSLNYFNPQVMDNQAQKEHAEPSIGGVAGLRIDYVKGLVTGLLRMVYERDSRRKFLPADHWLMVSRFDMTGFIPAVVEEEESRHKIQEEDADDLDELEEEEFDDTPQLIGTSRTQQQRRLEKLQRQQRKASRRRYLQAVAPRLEILQNMPFFIPFTTRVQIFREFVKLDMIKRRGSADPEFWRFRTMQQPNARSQLEKHTARIRRENEFDDAFEQFYELGQGLKEPIQITFMDQFGAPEAGIDGGGVTKEFLTSVTSRAFMPTDYIDMFVENDQHLLYPNPAALEEHKEALRQAGIREGSQEYRAQITELLQRYEFLGRIIGKCLYEGILVDVNFAPFFLRKWALTGGTGSAPNESGYRPTLNDLRDLDEELYQGLHKLKTYPGDVEDFSLNFTVTDTVVVDHTTSPKKTKAITKDLKPDGSNTPVTNQNRLVYISYMARHRLQNQPYAQTAAFLRGLSTMIQPSWLSMFNASELQTLISGTRTQIDIDDLRRNTLYGGTYVIGDDGLEHPTIQLFWKCMVEMSDEERRAVLKFVTSTPRAPLLGFGTLNPRFSIRDAGRDQSRLPSTSTCVNLLKLPMYEDEETLKEKLLYSVFSGAGFDLS